MILVSARIAEALPGANPIFLLGAHADVDPRTRGVKDLAETGKTRGVGFDEVEKPGREVGDAVAAAALDAKPEAAAVVGALSGRVRLTAWAESEAERAAALAALGPPAGRAARHHRLLPARDGAHAGPPARRAARAHRARAALPARRMAKQFAGGPEADVEAQVLRLGEARLAGFPLGSPR